MEYAGAVFLPAAGTRKATNVDNVGVLGYYWSSSPNEYTDMVHRLNFNSGSVNLSGIYQRHFGFSVRLITESK